MLRLPFTKIGLIAGIIAIPIVLFFVYMFNAYKLGKFPMKFYQDMTGAQKKIFRASIVVAVGILAGLIFLLLRSY